MFELLFLLFGGAAAAGVASTAEINEDGGGGGYAPPPGRQPYPSQPRGAGGMPYQARIEDVHHAPEESAPDDPGVRIQPAKNGHFYMPMVIAGCEDVGMYDPGASRVLLTRGYATRMGMNLRRLRYDGRTQVADRTVGVAHIIIPTLEVAGLIADNVEGAILERDSPDSTNLIGNAFLDLLTFSGTEKGADGRKTLVLVP